LKQYLPLIRSTHMTVTYNFDDFSNSPFYETVEMEIRALVALSLSQIRGHSSGMRTP